MMATVVGPFGGPGGDPWHDGFFFTGVRKIHISYGNAINSFRAVYDLNDNSFSGGLHGADAGGDNTADITLSFPNEVIQSVRGYTDGEVVRSLTFRTNQGRVLGPYGPEDGKEFNANQLNGVRGFLGRANDGNLIAIAIFTNP